MAITFTDRGNVAPAPGTNGTTTRTSASFSPTGGSKLIVVLAFYGQLQPASMSVADTFSGTGSWTMDGQRTAAKYTTWTLKTEIWSATLGASPGSGTVTVTRQSGSVDHWFSVEFYEVSEIGAAAQATSNLATTTTFTQTFGSAPAADSFVIGCLLTDVGSGGATPPTDWTESHDANVGYGTFEVAYKIGSAAQAPQWGTSSADDTRGCAVEYAYSAPGGATTRRYSLSLTGVG